MYLLLDIPGAYGLERCDFITTHAMSNTSKYMATHGPSSLGTFLSTLKGLVPFTALSAFAA